MPARAANTHPNPSGLAVADGLMVVVVIAGQSTLGQPRLFLGVKESYNLAVDLAYPTTSGGAGLIPLV
jgi:hypothetical protein